MVDFITWQSCKVTSLQLYSYKLVTFNSQINLSPFGPILEIHWHHVIFNFLHPFCMQLGLGLNPQSCLYIFKVFRAQSCLAIA